MNGNEALEPIQSNRILNSNLKRINDSTGRSIDINQTNPVEELKTPVGTNPLATAAQVYQSINPTGQGPALNGSN